MVAALETLNKILDRLPNFYKVDNDSNNYNLLLSFANSINKSSNQIANLKNSIQLSTASSTNLDDIGILFKMRRNVNESDISFRGRIQAYWSGLLGGGTNESIAYSVSNLLGIEKNNIIITSDEGIINVKILLTENVELILLDFVRENINNIKAAGTYLKNITLESENDIFRVNLSVTNGKDFVL